MNGQTKPDHRMAGLDALRFLATSIVIISHAHVFGGAGDLFTKTSGLTGRILSDLSSRGWAAVDVFFVLSGFLVSGLLFREAAQTGTVSVSRFLIRRGFKIYPAFWVMLAAALIWIYSIGHSVSAGALFSELLYLQNYGSGVCWHTWSLAVEEHFYFILAAIFWFYQRRGGRGHAPGFGWIPDLFLTVAVICLVLRAVTWAVICRMTPPLTPRRALPLTIQPF